MSQRDDKDKLIRSLRGQIGSLRSKNDDLASEVARLLRAHQERQQDNAVRHDQVSRSDFEVVRNAAERECRVLKAEMRAELTSELQAHSSRFQQQVGRVLLELGDIEALSRQVRELLAPHPSVLSKVISRISNFCKFAKR